MSLPSTPRLDSLLVIVEVVSVAKRLPVLVQVVSKIRSRNCPLTAGDANEIHPHYCLEPPH